MQVKSLRIKSYRSWTIDDTASTEAIDQLKNNEWLGLEARSYRLKPFVYDSGKTTEINRSKVYR